MSIPAVGHIGPAERAPVPPVRSADRVAPGRTIWVRPVGAADAIEHRTARPTNRAATEPGRGTAHQTNTDGDSATFSSGFKTGPARIEPLSSRDAEVGTPRGPHAIDLIA